MIVSELSSMTTDAVDFTDNDNFHVALQSCVIASIGSNAGTGHIKSTQDKPIDHHGQSLLSTSSVWYLPTLPSLLRLSSHENNNSQC